MIAAATSQSTPGICIKSACCLHPVRFEPLDDAQVERCDVVLDRFESAQLGGQEEPMMLLHSPLERQDEIGSLAARLPFGESGHLFDRGSALDQRLEHGPAGDAETSLITLASLRLAVSRGFDRRLRSAAWLSMSLRR